MSDELKKRLAALRTASYSEAMADEHMRDSQSEKYAKTCEVITAEIVDKFLKLAGEVRHETELSNAVAKQITTLTAENVQLKTKIKNLNEEITDIINAGLSK